MDKYDHSMRFYDKIAELQEKLRKSEEERLELEERFSVLMRCCREEEEAKVLSLRKQYDRFLKDDIKRRDRNERILHMLNSIENKASTLAAKSDRMQLLRRHFEVRLLQVYPNWKRNVDSGCSVTTPTPWERKIKPQINTSGLYNLSSSADRAATFHIPQEEYMSKLPSLYSSMYTKDTMKPNVDVQNPEGLLMTSNSDPGVHFHLKKDVLLEEKPLFDSGVTNIEELDKHDQLSCYIKKAARQLNYRLDENKNFKKSENDDSFMQATESKVGNSVDIECDQATSKDLLNVSLSDDGILQDETERLAIMKNKADGSSSKAVNETKDDIQLPVHPKEIKGMPVKHVNRTSGSIIKNQPYNFQDTPKNTSVKVSVEGEKPKNYDDSLKQTEIILKAQKSSTVDTENDESNNFESVVVGTHIKYAEERIGNQNNVEFQNQNVLQDQYETTTDAAQAQNLADKQNIQHPHTEKEMYFVKDYRHQKLHYPAYNEQQVKLDNNQHQQYKEINNGDWYQPELSDNQNQPELDNSLYQPLQQSPQICIERTNLSRSNDNQYQQPQQKVNDDDQYQAESTNDNFQQLQMCQSELTDDEYHKLQYEVNNEGQYPPDVSGNQYRSDISNDQYQLELYGNSYQQQYEQVNNEDQYSSKIIDNQYQSELYEKSCQQQYEQVNNEDQYQSELYDNSYQQQYEQVNNEDQYLPKITDNQYQSELYDNSYQQQCEKINNEDQQPTKITDNQYQSELYDNSYQQQYEQINNENQYPSKITDNQYQSELCDNSYQQQYEQVYNEDQYRPKITDNQYQSELFDNSYQQQYEQISNEDQYPPKMTDDHYQSELYDNSYHQQYQEVNNENKYLLDENGDNLRSELYDNQYQKVNNDEQYLSQLTGDQYQQLQSHCQFTSECASDPYHQMQHEQQNGLFYEATHQKSEDSQIISCSELANVQSQQAVKENENDQCKILNKNGEHHILDEQNQHQVSDEQRDVDRMQNADTHLSHELLNDLQYQELDKESIFQETEGNLKENLCQQIDSQLQSSDALDYEKEGRDPSFNLYSWKPEDTCDNVFENGKYHERTTAYEEDLSKKTAELDGRIKLQPESAQEQEIITKQNLIQYQSMFQNATDTDPAGFSDMDDVEDQLTELVGENQSKQMTFPIQEASSTVSDKTSTAKTCVLGNNLDALKDKSLTLQTPESSTLNNEKGLETGKRSVDNSCSKSDKHIMLTEPAPMQKSAKPAAKKLPSLSRMLESDTESLKIDSDLSNNDSDDFDFKSES